MKAFETKIDSLFNNNKVNQFVKEGLKESTQIISPEGALKYSTSGNAFVDDFASISHYKEPRSYKEVANIMDRLYRINPKDAVKMILYIRLITRKSQIMTDSNKVEVVSEVQKGQGLRHEAIMRMIWLSINHYKVFEKNLNLFIAAGSWKDIITMMNIDLQYNGWKNRKLNWTFMVNVIKAGLLNPNTTNLVRKYLPTIKTNIKCTTLESQADTIIGRYLASKFSPNVEKAKAYKAYRLIKSNGTAHEWQQKISQELYEEINFDTIAGRALALLVGSEFLKNHNLVSKYREWIMSKPIAKFTGYVHELFKPLGSGYFLNHIDDYLELTINAQFKQLVETGKSGNTNSKLLVVRDTSSSMTSKAIGCNVSSYDIGKAMALYFSEFLEGPFANSFAEFADGCVLKQWVGNTPCDKYINDRSEAYGGTYFMSVIDLFISLRKKGVPESDFPTGILCISDGCFSNYDKSCNSTNFNNAKTLLLENGFSKEYVENFKIILWDIPNNFYGKSEVMFEDYADASNFFYLSGYDTSVVSFVLGGNKPERKAPKNAAELMKAALDQELLNKVEIPKSRISKNRKVSKYRK